MKRMSLTEVVPTVNQDGMINGSGYMLTNLGIGLINKIMPYSSMTQSILSGFKCDCHENGLQEDCGCTYHGGLLCIKATNAQPSRV